MEHYRNGSEAATEANSVTLENSQERIQLLSELVDELMKDSPCDEIVRAFMKKAGLNYTEDSLEVLDIVLQALQVEGPHENLR